MKPFGDSKITVVIMGMNKLGIASTMMMMAAIMDPEMHEIVERGRVPSNKPLKRRVKKSNPKPFHKQDGIVNMIKQFHEIDKGISKLGKSKQIRVVKKIEAYLESGKLTEEHFKQ